MESHAVSARLHENRERMRTLLLRDTTGGGGAGTFPRSALMRFVFNSGARRAVMSLLSVFLMMRGRRRHRRVPRLSLLPRLASALGGLTPTRRH
jgi:hypothetical protein